MGANYCIYQTQPYSKYKKTKFHNKEKMEIELGLTKKDVIQRMSLANLRLSSLQLNNILNFLRTQVDSNPSLALDNLIKKIIQLTTLKGAAFDDRILAECILSFGSEMNIIDIIRDKYYKSIVITTPYQVNSTVFAESESTAPAGQLFKFLPETKMRNARQRLANILSWNTSPEYKVNNHFIGILVIEYEIAEKQHKFYLQNETQQVRLDLSAVERPLQKGMFRVQHAVYVALGTFDSGSGNLVFKVKQLRLPKPQPVKFYKQPALVKFKAVVENLLEIRGDNIADSSLTLWPRLNTRTDIFVLDLEYGARSKHISLFFGNVVLNEATIAKLRVIISELKAYNVCCVVLFLSHQRQPITNLNLIFPNPNPFPDCKVLLVPHLYSPGPQLLPRIPIVKEPFEGRNLTIMTNPSKFTVEGRTCVMCNYPICKKLYKSRFLEENNNQVAGQGLEDVARFLYSQNNVGLFCGDIFWQQESYMSLSSAEYLFMYDEELKTSHVKLDDLGVTAINLGDFCRDGEFYMFVSSEKDPVNRGDYAALDPSRARV